MTKGCDIDCTYCPLSSYNNGKDLSCVKLEGKHQDDAVEIVKKWAKENPEKTYLTEFMKAFPNSENSINFCAKLLGYKGECYGIGHCEKCWNTSLED